MKYLIFSDLHGSQIGLERLRDSIEKEKPDILLFLGDGLYGAADANPRACLDFFEENAKRLIAVCGNGDSPSDFFRIGIDLPARRGFDFAGHRVHALHHPNSLAFPPGDIVLFGHTHRKVLYSDRGVIRLNPGSLSLPRDGSPSYALMSEEGLTLKNAKTGECLESLLL